MISIGCTNKPTNQLTNQPKKKKMLLTNNEWLVPKTKCVNHECCKLGFFGFQFSLLLQSIVTSTTRKRDRAFNGDTFVDNVHFFRLLVIIS